MPWPEPFPGSETPPDDYFRQLADGAPVMIWMAGLDMGCFYFNRAWLDFRGRTLEQEQGNGWAEGVHPEDLQRCVSHYVSSFEQRMAFAMSYRLKNARGEYVWILDRGAPHHLPDGTFLGFFGGCAEIEYEGPVARNAQLGATLKEMKAFAQQIAANEGLTAVPAPGVSPSALRSYARDIHESGEMAYRQHAAKEMHILAADMATFGTLPRCACLP
jgi:PAS domain S-box-containing protein